MHGRRLVWLVYNSFCMGAAYISFTTLRSVSSLSTMTPMNSTGSLAPALTVCQNQVINTLTALVDECMRVLFSLELTIFKKNLRYCYVASSVLAS